MKKQLLILILLPVLTLLFITQSNSTVIQNNKDVNIIISDNIVKTIIPDISFVGVNWFDDHPAFRKLFTSSNQLDELGKTLKKHNIDIIRYPGGHNIYTFFWDVKAENVKEALKKLPKKDIHLFYQKKLKNTDKFYYGDFLAFCKKHELKAVVQFNTQWYFDKTNNEMLPLKAYPRYSDGKKNTHLGKINWKLVNKAAKYAAELVSRTKQDGYMNVVKYWELGNEEYNAYNLGAGFTGKEYAKVCAVFIKEIKKVAPDIKFILTNAAVDPEVFKNNKKWIRIQNDWTQDILNTPELAIYKDDFVALSNHHYPTGKTRKDKTKETFIKHVYKKLNIKNLINAHADIAKGTVFANKDIFINEFNTHWFDNPLAHSWAAAIANANYIMSCANTPLCAHMDYHNIIHLNGCYSGINKNRGFGMFHYAKDFSMPVIPYPDATVTSFLNQYTKGNILKTLADNEFIYTVTTKKNNHIYLLILNKKSEHSVTLKFSGFTDIKYIENKILGLDVPLEMTAMSLGTSCFSPEEVRLINVLDNKLQVKKINNDYKVNLPQNTLSVFVFKD